MAWPSEIKAVGGSVFGALARVLYALYTYGEQLYNAITNGGPWGQSLTLSLTIANGGVNAVSEFNYKSGAAFSALTATVRRITIINKSGGALILIGDADVSNDIELPLDDDESYTLFVSDATKVRVKNSSGGDLTCYAIVEGTFAEVGA